MPLNTKSSCVLSVLVLGLALTGSAASQLRSTPADETPGCAAILAGLRALEASTLSTLAEVQDQRRQAERSAAWFGAEQFDPYIAALREQERQLQVSLTKIRTLSCHHALDANSEKP